MGDKKVRALFFALGVMIVSIQSRAALELKWACVPEKKNCYMFNENHGIQLCFESGGAPSPEETVAIVTKKAIFADNVPQGYRVPDFYKSCVQQFRSYNVKLGSDTPANQPTAANNVSRTLSAPFPLHPVRLDPVNTGPSRVANNSPTNRVITLANNPINTEPVNFWGRVGNWFSSTADSVGSFFGRIWRVSGDWVDRTFMPRSAPAQSTGTVR